MTNDNRTPAGVPTGGEFATGARAESDDLEPDSGYVVCAECGGPMEVGEDGTANHTDEDGNPDFDADSDHQAQVEDDYVPLTRVQPAAVDLHWDPVPIKGVWRSAGPAWTDAEGNSHIVLASITATTFDDFTITVTDGAGRSEEFSANTYRHAREVAGKGMGECLENWEIKNTPKDTDPLSDESLAAQLAEWGGPETWKVYRPVTDPQWRHDLARMASTYSYGTQGVHTDSTYPVDDDEGVRITVTGKDGRKLGTNIFPHRFRVEAGNTKGGAETAAAYLRVLRSTEARIRAELEGNQS